MTTQDEPTHSATIVVLALIRALHEEGILPAQATATMLDRLALNAMRREAPSDRESAMQQIAVAIQTAADGIERSHPFVARRQPRPAE